MAHKICPVEDIKPGRAIRVLIDGHAIAIARTKSGDVKAIDDKCSHGEISLSEGFVITKPSNAGHTEPSSR